LFRVGGSKRQGTQSLGAERGQHWAPYCVNLGKFLSLSVLLFATLLTDVFALEFSPYKAREQSNNRNVCG
jgi:hypothetical protein